MCIRPQKVPTPKPQIAQDVLDQKEMFFLDVHKKAMQGYFENKAHYGKKSNKPTTQNLNKQNTFTSYSRKQISKELKFLLQIVGGLDFIILKRCYRTTNIWYAKLAPITSKCFIEWGCADSLPANLYRINKSLHVRGN